MAERTTADWLALLEPAGVPCGPVNGVRAAFADPQIQARGMVARLSHPLSGEVPTVASPMKFSRTDIAHDRAPPTLGEHTEAILRDVLGSSEEEIALWRSQGAI